MLEVPETGLLVILEVPRHRFFDPEPRGSAHIGSGAMESVHKWVIQAR